ncbi:hypothetical protein HPT27_06635 [Permianibacter sp. IMCC34836]|uniref:hypothetical protein n=1 Tax=Permianibacter fluminis TaxID=2738515 RepID=UPI0015549A61|nr:hypothetical protein [Permianibacter fluminis]NQD36696.1 hypothetical protein [Permianibacter fluminis]
MLSQVAGLPENSWWLASRNAFHEVWTPAAQRPLNRGRSAEPSRLITAWGGFAWDSKRSSLWLFGGGHGDYSGNDVYVWQAQDGRWQRAALPSEIRRDEHGIEMAIDGVDMAPIASHTYDNNVYLPRLDRLLSFGGAAYNNGDAWRRSTADGKVVRTGPYLFDVARADGSKLGGSSGSQVQREPNAPAPEGAQLWQNRDSYEAPQEGTLTPSNHVNGCTAYSEENAEDVVYVAARVGKGTALNLFRYRILDIAKPTADSWQHVGGYWQGPSDQTACGYDPVHQLLVRTGSSKAPFLFWSLQQPGPENRQQVMPYTDTDGSFKRALAQKRFRPRDCGLDYDRKRNRFALWCGGQAVWVLAPSADTSKATATDMSNKGTPKSAPGNETSTTNTELTASTADIADDSESRTPWRLSLLPDHSLMIPEPERGNGVLGKWHYAPELDVFVALQNGREGLVWFYKPANWQPENSCP